MSLISLKCLVTLWHRWCSDPHLRWCTSLSRWVVRCGTLTSMVSWTPLICYSHFRSQLNLFMCVFQWPEGSQSGHVSLEENVLLECFALRWSLLWEGCKWFPVWPLRQVEGLWFHSLSASVVTVTAVDKNNVLMFRVKQEKNCSHEVTVVLFSRTFYNAKIIGE